MPFQKHNDSEPLKRPSIFLLVMEFIRFIPALCIFFWQFYTYRSKTIGDGHPVVVIPGLMCNDAVSFFLRRFLEKIAYKAYGWKLGLNLGNINQLDRLAEYVEFIHLKHQCKVSLIGWSLGGVYARQIARQAPEKIDQIITIGSPLNSINLPNNAAWLFKLIQWKNISKYLKSKWIKKIGSSVDVPTTALYSKIDGIVPWRGCLETPEDEIHQNIEVHSGHFGMVFNMEVYRIIESRLLNKWFQKAGNSKEK